jgi:TolB protein
MMKIVTVAFVLIASAMSTFSQAPVQTTDEMISFVQDFCWSPNGRSIYFSAMNVKEDFSDFKPEKWGIYRYDFSTKTVTKIVDSALNVTVSPDGKKIAVGKLVDGNRDIYVMDKDGKNPQRITTDKADDLAPAWSPNGKQILFNNRTDGKPEIYIINVNGTDRKRLTFSGEFKSYNPSWSPNGKAIAYYFEKGDGKDQLFVMNADGTDPKNITNDEFNNIFPGWLNNNKIIYGQGLKGKPTKVFTINADGTEKKQLMSLESFYARSSPDGKKIAFVSNQDGGKPQIFVMNSDGSDSVKITK